MKSTPRRFTPTPIPRLATVLVPTLPFTAHAFAFCDPTYPNALFTNALFTMDPASGSLPGLLGSLDSGQLGPCTSGLTGGAQIA